MENFCVADVIEVLTDSNDVRQYIKRLRQRDSELNSVWGTICTPHQFISTDGKKHAVNCASIGGILRIVQSIPSKKAEPFKRWLAQVGAMRSHQHKPEQYKGNTLHYSDKNFAIHSFTPLGHATHHTERACDGGEYGNQYLEQLAPIEGASTLAVLHSEWCGVQ